MGLREKAKYYRFSLQPPPTNYEKKLLELQTLLEVNKELGATLKSEELLQILLFTLMGQFQLSEVAIYQKEDTSYILAQQQGMDTIDTKVDFGIEALFSQKLVKEFTGGGFFSSLAKPCLLVPLMSKHGWNGFLLLGPRGEGVYQEEDYHFIEAVASLAGSALENAHLYTSLQQAYEALERKLKQLSALYEISTLINSSDDFDLIASLLQETLATGFGVTSSLLLVFQQDKARVAFCYQIDQFQVDQRYVLSPEEEACFSDNQPRVISSSSWSKSPYVFLPLSTVKRRVGGLIILSLENQPITSLDTETLNLFAIIASQIAPPLLLSQWIREKSLHNPFETLFMILRTEAQKAREFGVGMTLLYLKLNNLSKYPEFYSEEQTLSLLHTFEHRVVDALPSLSQWVHYDLERFLFVFTGVPSSDVEAMGETLHHVVAEVFSHQGEIPIQVQTSLASYPEEGESLLPYITKLMAMV
ncbi:MAG: GAF domain-containing protein [Brevinematales bacterium]|nr:GAF domain-containing protein [Brevinematales bacterium]